MMKTRTRRIGLALAAGIGAAGCACADDAPAKWSDTLTFSGQLDAGGDIVSDSGPSGRIFGRLFDDKANNFQLNQAMLTATRPLDPAATGYDFGFKLQGFYGSDARYTRFTKQFVSLTDQSENQFDLVEANILIHAPGPGEGGLDLKIGQYSTPIGTETIDPSANYFYSHSYIFNFADPLKHTGVLATWHMVAGLDVYLGMDTGINTGFDNFPNHAQNGGPPAFIGGLGLTFLDGDLTVLALTHIGTEIPSAAVANGLLPSSVSASGAYRKIWDVVTTWKVNDKVTLVNEANWISDDALNNGSLAEGYGMAQYATYALDDNLSLVGRAEIFVDNQNAFVGQFGSNADFMRGEEGYAPLSPYTVTGGKLGQRTVYGELTVGLNWKPALPIPHLSSLTIRPEIRADGALSGGSPFSDGKDRQQTTFAIDAIIAF
jgi:hypothetical protein